MKKLISVELVEDDGKLTINWSAERGDVALLDQLLQTVAALRATLQPAIQQAEPGEAYPLDWVDDPRWQLGMDAVSHTALLSLRHPGFGWMGFRLPDESKDRLRRLLA